MKNLYARLYARLISLLERHQPGVGGMELPNREIVSNLSWIDPLGDRIDTLAAATTANEAAISRELKAREVASAATTPEIS